MNFEELTDKEKEVWNYVYRVAYDNGFADGLDAENNSDAIEEAREQGYSDGFDAGQDVGWDEGYDAANSEKQNDEYDTGYHNGFIAGAEAEQARIQSVLGMMFESALNMGQGNKAVQYKHAMELLRPIDLTKTVDEDF